jgi:hypothetical protein
MVYNGSVPIGFYQVLGMNGEAQMNDFHKNTVRNSNLFSQKLL